VLLAVDDDKSNFDEGVEALKLLLFIVDGGCEVNSIDPRLKLMVRWQQVLAATVSIRVVIVEERPYAVDKTGKRDGNSRSRTAASRVENMRRDAHCLLTFNHLFKRSCVIWRCCSAASRSSVAWSFCMRALMSARISAEVFPEERAFLCRLR